MDQDRPYWDMEIEPKFNSPEMAPIQLNRLKTMLGRLNAGAPFYTRLFGENKIDPGKINSFGEFKEKVPLFDKKALLELLGECGGDVVKTIDQIIPIPVDDLDWFATTTGTTGVPTPYPMTNNDVQNIWGEVMARGGWRAGVRKADRVLFCFALSMVIAGVPTLIGFQKLGVTMLPVGAEAKSERILMMQGLFRGTIYAGTPSLAEYLIEQSPKLTGKPVSELGFRALVCGGEPGAGIPEVKKKLESAYGCRIFDAGAGFGCSCDHAEYQGMHWLGDDLAFYELVDPETKEPIPFEDGAKGEALFTSLLGDGWVMVRQSMGDIHQVFTEPCPCGRTGFRYKVIGRADDMLKVKGVMVYPSHIKGVIQEFIPRVTGEMRIILDEKPPRVVPPLKIRLEYGEDMPEDALLALENEIADAMSRKLKIHPKIIWAGPGSLERSHYKGQTFEKVYEEKK